MQVRITLVNDRLSRSAELIVDRETGRLSRYQVERARRALGGAAEYPSGALGEWPLRQRPPEAPGTEYVVVLDRSARNGSPRSAPYRLIPSARLPEFPGALLVGEPRGREQAETDQV